MRLCEVIEVNRSSFYAWDAAAPIRVVHEADKAYGAPRVTAELNDSAPPGERVNHKRVARVMTEHGIAGIRLRRRVRVVQPASTAESIRSSRPASVAASTRRRTRPLSPNRLFPPPASA